jgi:hypothetical protein
VKERYLVGEVSWCAASRAEDVWRQHLRLRLRKQPGIGAIPALSPLCFLTEFYTPSGLKTISLASSQTAVQGTVTISGGPEGLVEFSMSGTGTVSHALPMLPFRTEPNGLCVPQL